MSPGGNIRWYPASLCVLAPNLESFLDSSTFLGWVPSLETDRDTRIGGQVVYVGGDPSKHQDGCGEGSQGRDEIISCSGKRPE